MESSLTSRPAQGRLLLVADVGLGRDLSVRRMAREFARSGLAVEHCGLAHVPPGRFDFCILGNVVESVAGSQDDQGRRRIDSVCRASDIVLSLSADRVDSSRHQLEPIACRDLGINHVLDVGFIPQGVEEARRAGVSHHFVFDGLTHDEAEDAEPSPDDRDRRIIPWTFVGRQTPNRVALASRLVGRVSPRGFVYLPDEHPHEKEGPRPLDPGQMDRVLRATRFAVWLGEHGRLEFESPRFRACLRAGCLPLIVVGEEADLPDELPFRDFVVRESEVVDRLKLSDFEAERRSFRAEYLQRPRLGDGLCALLDALSGHAGLTVEPEVRPLGRCA